MPVESATFIGQLNTAYPMGTEAKSQGDDHIRLLKSCLKNTFSGFTNAIIAYGSETAGSNDNIYNVNISATMASYPPAMFLIFVSTHTNTDSATLNVNGMGNLTIYNMQNKTLRANEIQNNQLCFVLIQSGKATLINPLSLNAVEGRTYEVDTNDNKLATTQFVHNAIANYISATDTQWVNPVFKYTLQTTLNIL